MRAAVTHALLGIACALALAQSLHAAELRCAGWHVLAAEQKDSRLRERIGAVVRSPEMLRIEIDHGALRRCLEAEQAGIRDTFEDTCAERHEADLQALHQIFRDFVASCAG